MNDYKRDLRKPISYCCGKMEYELSKGDIIDYVWYTRLYLIRSSVVPEIHTYVKFCPFCGKDVGKYAVYDEYEEYWEAYDKAREEDPTLPDIESDSEVEGFREKFLRTWEAENETGNS